MASGQGRLEASKRRLALEKWKRQRKEEELDEEKQAASSVKFFLDSVLEVGSTHFARIKMMKSGKFVTSMGGDLDVLSMKQSIRISDSRPWLDVTLRRIFGEYCGHRQSASADFSTVMSISDWFSLLDDCKLLEKLVSRGQAVVCFYNVLGRQQSYDRNMSFSEFRWLLRELATAVFGKELGYTEAMRRLLKQHILLHAKRIEAHNPLLLLHSVKAEFAKHDMMIRKVFLHYCDLEVVTTTDHGDAKWEDSQAQDASMSQPEFITFSHNFDIVPLCTLYEVTLVFREVSLLYPNAAGDASIEYEGFLECIARLALKASRRAINDGLWSATGRRAARERREEHRQQHDTDEALNRLYSDLDKTLFNLVT